MSGIDNITENILREASEKAEAVLSEARIHRDAEIKNIISDAEADGKAAVDSARRRAFELVNRAKTMSDLEKRKKILAAKREMIDEVFDRINLAFSNMSTDEYTKYLSAMAVSAGGEKGGTIVFSVSDSKYAQIVFSMLDGSKFKLSDEYTDSVPNGFLLCDGDVYTECSVRASVEEQRRELETEIAKILFGENDK